MATNPMLQGVLLWQHHQSTTPYRPGTGGVAAATEPLENVGVSIPPPEAALPLEEKEAEEESNDEEEEDEEEEDEEEEDEEEEENG